jgi:polyphenol oxidase
MRFGKDGEVTETIAAYVDEAERAAGLLVGFTDRRGGVSAAPYDSLNLAARVGDDPDAVEENRRRAARAVGFDPSTLTLARQVHGATVIEARAGSCGVIGEADVLVAREPGATIAILTADCAPVVLRGDGGIAVAHAGWRGLVGGAIESALVSLGGAGKAWVGPCIHSCCYEVGDEVIDAFRAKDLPVHDGTHVSPRAAAVAILERSGVGDIWASPDCTHCNHNYFSYRRDGTTGRQGSFASLLP